MSFCGVTVTANKLANLPICLVIFRARGISFARPVAPPPEVSIANHACVGSLKSEA